MTAFHARSFERLLPFPPLRFGWGLDAYWGAIARQEGWRLGVVDATPVRHGLRRVSPPPMSAATPSPRPAAFSATVLTSPLRKPSTTRRASDVVMMRLVPVPRRRVR